MRATLTAAAALAAASAPAFAGFAVSYENPGVYQSSATFTVKGVETFDSRRTGADQTFSTNFDTNGVFTGVYTGVQINSADQYGGQDGTGKYAVTFSTQGYSLDLSTTQASGINYFGYWLSALDHGNRVTFYKGDAQVFQYNPTDVLAVVHDSPAYFGNPGGPYQGRDSREPFVFLNFFDVEDTFNRVVFAEDPQSGGYESDNHTVGYYTQRAGNVLPEPGVWAMLLAGFGLTGQAARRRRRRLALVSVLG